MVTTKKKASAAKKKTAAPKKSTSKKKANGEVGIRIRMYRVGFGDFFLVRFGAEGGAHEYVIIDCGVHGGTTGKGDIGTLALAVEDMVKETRGRAALIVATHRHADHIMGFSKCAEQFEKLRADAVWMSIWETEYDEKIKKLQAELTGMAVGLQTHLAANGAAEHGDTLALLYNATGVEALAGKRRASNAASLERLKTGFGVEPHYYARNDKPKLPSGLAKAGVKARILGPPGLDDEIFMKMMDLKKGVGQYLDAANAKAASSADFAPFANAWNAPAASYGDVALREWLPRGAANGGGGKDGPKASAAARARMEGALRSAQPTAFAAAAKSLDRFLNNQSLVILFEYEGKNLLFVGDAQGGNWERWIYDSDEPDREVTSPLSKQGRDILGSLDFYKVGHHGSTNATPIPVVGALPEGVVAMCSTQEDTYPGTLSKGTEVPRIPLLDALKDRCSLVRSDHVSPKVDGKKIPRGKKLDAKLKEPTQGRLVEDVNGFWIDYFL
jgi:hypothetical protein